MLSIAPYESKALCRRKTAPASLAWVLGGLGTWERRRTGASYRDTASREYYSFSA